MGDHKLGDQASLETISEEQCVPLLLGTDLLFKFGFSLSSATLNVDSPREKEKKKESSPPAKPQNAKGHSPPPSNLLSEDPTCKPLIVRSNPCTIICPALRKHKTAPAKEHRHSETVNQALNLLKVFAARTDKCDAQGMPESGLDCLEKQQWDYHGMTKGIRVYSKSGDAVFEESVVNFQYSKHEEDYEIDESLPYIRGEGWIEGDWEVEDVLATIRNFGARAVWDMRLEAADCRVVQVLNENDLLCQLRTKAIFPVGARDIVAAVSYATNCDATVGYWAARSVIDAAVPPDPTIHRAHMHMMGWILRKLPYPPEYDYNQCILPMKVPKRPPSEDSPPSAPGSATSDSYFPFANRSSTSIETRHRSSSNSSTSQRASLYGPSLSSAAAREPVRPTTSGRSQNPTRRSALREMGISIPRAPPSSFPSPRASATIATTPITPVMEKPENGRSSSFSSVNSGHRRRSSSACSENSSESDLPPRKPGIHVSIISRVSPGGPIPTSFRNAITLKVPLSIADLGVYLAKYGFAPYLQRKDRTSGLDVVEEDFKPLEGSYKVIYRCHPEVAGGTTRIRFYGGAFSHGKFSIEILRATEWHVEYDNPPDIGQHVPTEPTISPGDGALGSKTSSMVFLDAPPLKTARPMLTPLEHPRSLQAETVEGPRMPGPQGPCTLVIKNTVIGIPIQVVITKMPEKLKVTMPRKLSQAIGHASRIHAEHIRSASIEDLVKRATPGTRQHALGVESAKEVFRRLSAASTSSSGSSTPSRASRDNLRDPVPLYQTRDTGVSSGSTESNSTADSSLFTLSLNLGHSSDFTNTPSSSIPTTPNDLATRRSTGQSSTNSNEKKDRDDTTPFSPSNLRNPPPPRSRHRGSGSGSGGSGHGSVLL